MSESILKARLARRILFFEDRPLFMEMYHRDMKAGVKAAAKKGLPVVARLNMLTDVEWERRFPEMIENYPDVQFSEYTKLENRFEKFLDGKLPRNLWLTFSRSELNEEKAVDFLQRGGNVSVIFSVKYGPYSSDPLPETWKGFRVVDGDVTDMRHLDMRGRPGFVVGLRGKGKARRGGVTSGFVATPLYAAA